MRLSALLYLEIGLAQRLKQNVTPVLDQDGNRTGWVADDLNTAERKALKIAKPDVWKKPTINSRQFVVFQVYSIPRNLVEGEDTLVWLEHFKDTVIEKLNTGLGNQPLANPENWGGVIGCWEIDGRQYGTEWIPPEYDDQGQETQAGYYSGTPVYPILAEVLQFMPDDVTYDENGNEVSRTPAVAPKEVHKISGHGDRVWVI